MFRNDDIIKNRCDLQRKKFLPKSFPIDSRKSHKISKRFDEKQKNWQAKDEDKYMY